jgi:Protein of unknown function (DUF3307)
MDDIFVMIIFGHFVGDFFLQHKLMAENKFQSGWRASGWWRYLHKISRRYSWRESLSPTL